MNNVSILKRTVFNEGIYFLNGWCGVHRDFLFITFINGFALTVAACNAIPHPFRLKMLRVCHVMIGISQPVWVIIIYAVS